MKALLRITSALHSADILVIGFALILTAVSITFSYRIPAWSTLVVINIGAILLICALGILRQRSGSRWASAWFTRNAWRSTTCRWRKTCS